MTNQLRPVIPLHVATVDRPDLVFLVMVLTGANGFFRWNSSTISCAFSMSLELIQESSSGP